MALNGISLRAFKFFLIFCSVYFIFMVALWSIKPSTSWKFNTLLLRNKRQTTVRFMESTVIMIWLLFFCFVSFITWRWRCVEVGVSSRLWLALTWVTAINPSGRTVHFDGSGYKVHVSMASPVKSGFCRLEIQKTTWDVQDRYTSLKPVGSGAYGTVW